MMRIIVVAVLSVALGAMATRLLTRDPGSSITTLGAEQAAGAGGSSAAGARSLEAVFAQDSAVERRAAVYQVVARADEDALQSLLEDASWLAASELKDLLLEALSLRLAELDTDAGMSLLSSLALDASHASSLGIALFKALGLGSESLRRVSAAMPQIDARRFRIEALEHWADVAPAEALQEVTLIGDWQLRSDAVERVAAVWARNDIPGAIEQAERLGDDRIGRAFRSALVRAMIEIDPAAMVAYLNASPEHENRLAGVVTEQLRLMAPQEALGWAEQLVGRIGQSARRTALEGWGEEDPLAAFAYAEAMPLGEERLELLHAIARGYGRQDPEGALVWVDSLRQAPPDIAASVIAGIAQVDAERGLELAFSQETAPSSGGYRFSRGRFGMLRSVIGNAMSSPEIETSQIVERVLALPDPNERSNALNVLADRWMRDDPGGAFEWVATAVNVPEQNHGDLIRSLTRYDPLLAASYTERVPAAMRDVWIATVAQDYARLDPQAAVDWLGGFRDEPVYSAGVAAIVHRAVDYDPPMAARLLATVGDAGRNAQSAAESVARAWAEQDEPAARLWVAGLPLGPVRDSALEGFIRRGPRDTMPEPALLALFSTDERRQRALTQVIYGIGADDPGRARRLLDEHISIPELRGQVESWLARREEQGVVVYPGGVVIHNVSIR